MGIETASQYEQVQQWRADFPLLNQLVNGQPLVYLDNAATTQKPQVVIDRLQRYYALENANIHRGVHALSQRATEDYEEAREVVARFLGGVESRCCAFVRGATEGINLVAHSYLRPRLQKGDVILLTGMEHHANIVPWQLVAEEKGARIEVVPVTPEGELDLDALRQLLRAHPVKLLAFVHTSNSLGTINPAREIIAAAREAGVPVLLDAAQATPHQPLDVPALDPDFLVFSGHKTFGPTGIGVLYGKWQHLKEMPPYQGGGDMILKVSFEKTTFKEPPERFEAGTPHIAGVIGLATALEYFLGLDHAALLAHEQALRLRAEEGLREIDGLRLIGQARHKTSVVSFVVDDVHPHDIGTFLDQEGIAIRAGHHCTQPLMKHLGLPGTARASFCFYNTLEEADALVRGVRRIVKFFR
ncbi:MAG: SufS family cysteine desulfurase [Verrucomicrobiota bacterium JB022]|nr:SufS family cysteine desulfurase [Verrucomicrobiota bacterium JB022]